MNLPPIKGQYDRGIILLAVAGAGFLLLSGLQAGRLTKIFSFAAQSPYPAIWNLALLSMGLLLPVVVLPVCRRGHFTREMAFAAGLFAAGLLDCVSYLGGDAFSSYWLAARLTAGAAAAAAACIPRRSHNLWLNPVRLLAGAGLFSAAAVYTASGMPLTDWYRPLTGGISLLEGFSAVIIIASAWSVVRLGRYCPRRSECGYLRYALVLFSISVGFLLLYTDGIYVGQAVQTMAYFLVVRSVYASAVVNPARRDIRQRRSLAHLLKRYQTLQTAASADRQLARDSLQQVSSEKNYRLVRELFNQVRMVLQPRTGGEAAAVVAQLASANFQETFVVIYFVQPDDTLQPAACLGPLPAESFAWQYQLIKMVYSQNRSLVVEDLSKSPYDGLFHQSNGVIRSLVAAPLPGTSQTLGVIVMLSRQPGRFSPPAAASLATFAQNAAILLEIDRAIVSGRQASAGAASLMRLIKMTERPGNASEVLQAAAELSAEWSFPRAMAGFLIRIYPDGLQPEVVYTKNLSAADVDSFQRIFKGFPLDWPGEDFDYNRLSSPFLRPISFSQARNGNSVELLPIVSRGSLLGLLLFVRDEAGMDHTVDPLQFRALAMICALMMERANLVENVREVGFTDALTGLSNRRFFDFSITREIGRAKRYNRPLALLMIDIDFFKNINDTYGHRTGDAVLRELGLLLRTHFRKTDFPARYGGEEFVVILPETSREAASALAERFRMIVEGKNFVTEHGPIRVTVSIGAAAPDFEQIPETSVGAEVLEMADQALYRAKQNGRNRLIFF